MSLGGLHVLNTRPAHQAAALGAALSAAGARVSDLPLIAITPRPLSPEDERLLLDLDRYDGVFFISANAARLGLDAIAGYWPQWPFRLPCYAVGERTATVLRDAGLDVVVPERADSEGLLALPALQDVAGRRFLLLRGEGGRELLPETLRARGARVDVVALYRRELPEAAARQWAALAHDLPGVVLLTSPDALRHWREVAGAQALVPRWLVVSPRLAVAGREAGAHIIEAAAADAGSIVAALEGAVAAGS